MRFFAVYSRAFHIAALFCFLLPFYRSCGPGAEEKRKAEEQRLNDSISQRQNGLKADTIIAVTNEMEQEPVIEKSRPKQESKADEAYSVALSNRYPALKLILNPDENVHTGLAAVVNVIPFISVFAGFITLVLLFLSLLTKWIENGAHKTIILIESTALFFLFLAQYNIMPAFNTDMLWGYTLCMICLCIVVLTDVISLIKHRSKRSA